MRSVGAWVMGGIGMSTESPAASRHPKRDSALGDSEPEPPELPNDLPRPAEKVAGFVQTFPELSHRPICETDGRELRPECVEEETRTYTVETGSSRVEREEVVERTAVPAVEAVAEMLDWHAGYHRSALRFEYGVESDPTHEEVDVPMENSWMVDYQEKERARLKALERETCGFERCVGGVCETRWCDEPEHETEWVSGEFEDPVVVLTTRTASGDGVAPVDHARSIAEAWSGESWSDGARRSLRYVMEERLGLEKEEWVRWSQGEPHTSKRAGSGYGTNAGYHHDHDVIILDGAAVSGSVTVGDFRTVIESHVDNCLTAGREAHDLDVSDWDANAEDVGTVEVKRVEEEIEVSVASYAAAYLANEKKDLLERSPEYLLWAATMWAFNQQKATGTDNRTHAIDADRCKHKHHTGDQERGHGDEVIQKRVRGERVIACLECGSPWGIDQDQTLAGARLSGSGTVVADGGVKPPSERVEEDLRERWPSARSAATVVEIPGEGVRTVGFERPPRWRLKAVIRGGEERSTGGGSLNKRPVKLRDSTRGRVSMALRGPGVLKCLGCGSVFDVVGEYADHGCDGVRPVGVSRPGMVGVGWLGRDPPAEEGVERREEFLSLVPDRYLDGGENAADGGGGGSCVPVGRVEEYAVGRSGVTVPEVLGRFGLSPESAGAVSEVLADASAGGG